MAVITYTTYTDSQSCATVNTYISDGHGNPAAERSNIYISNGHGDTTICVGHHCPNEPGLATAYMETVRRNYERQHTIDPNRQKGQVNHVQIYVCPSEVDHVPAEERMEMTRELIEGSELRHFPSIYITHDNTPLGHCHVSLCPFSQDGSHKLSMNNKLLYDLRRMMDRNCVTHGYSIIERQELWGDKEYRDWFLDIKERGIVTIHPPKTEDAAVRGKQKKRARDYSRSKRAQKKWKEEREAFLMEITSGYSPEVEGLFYTSEYLYHPNHPEQPLRIKRITEEGKLRSELELQSFALGLWGYHCAKVLEEKNGMESLHRRLRGIMEKAFAVKDFLSALDIRTQEELVYHIKECGQDIGTLKRSIKNLEAELVTRKPIIQAVERWEGEKDPGAKKFLAEQKMDNGWRMEKIKEDYAFLLGKKEHHQVLLEQCSKEYRYLKEVETFLNPVSCKAEWEQYLANLFSRNVLQKAKWFDTEHLEKCIYELGMLLGIPEEDLDRYILEVKEHPEVIRSKEYQDYRKGMISAEKRERKGYARYYQGMDVLDDLWDLQQKLEGFGLLGFLLSVLVETVAEMNEHMTKLDLSIALWEAGMERWYADLRRRGMREKLPYHPEVLTEFNKEQQEMARRVQELAWELSGLKREEKQERKHSFTLDANALNR